MVDIKEISENIYLIDDLLYSIPEWGSVYLLNEEKKAIVDTGPTTSARAVLEGIDKLGVGADEIDYMIVTHIHLDHAGGAGRLLRDMPRAKVVVHHRASRHLVTPDRLVRSVAEAQGEAMMAKIGEVVPVDGQRVVPVAENDEIKLSAGQVLRFLETPGHAPHELCILESRNNGLFSGDAIGVSVAENSVLLPVTPPPSFDLPLYLASLERLVRLDASRIYYAHFGATDRVSEDLRRAADLLQAWDKLVSRAIDEDGFDNAAEKLRQDLCAELEPVRRMELLHKYLTEELVPMNVAGYMKYIRDKRSTS